MQVGTIAFDLAKHWLRVHGVGAAASSPITVWMWIALVQVVAFSLNSASETALISTAAAPVVLAASRTLLNDPEFAWEADDSPSRPSPPPGPQSSPAHSPEWDDLRQRVREAKAQSGVSNQTLAEALGLAFSTLHSALGARRQPGRALMQRLEGWLNKAPKVCGGHGVQCTFGPMRSVKGCKDAATAARSSWQEKPLAQAYCSDAYSADMEEGI